MVVRIWATLVGVIQVALELERVAVAGVQGGGVSKAMLWGYPPSCVPQGQVLHTNTV